MMSIPTENIEDRIQEAVKAYHASTKPNLTQLARDYGISRGRLRGRVMGRQSNPDRAKATRSLNLIQEKVLTTWVQTLDSAYISPTPEMVEGAANTTTKSAKESHVKLLHLV